MERLLILDSNSLLNRAFYAIPELTTSEGVHTNAVYGFTNMLFKMKEELKPDYIVAAFDKKAPTFRHLEYKEYKAGRKKMPGELAEQFPLIKELLDLFAISIYEIDGFEADDIIGSLAKYAEKHNIEVYVVTGDKDALQLASENIHVVITKKGVTETAVYDEKTFIEEYGVTPTQFIDVKGLMGDKSDNIPGVPGVGEKTAYKLIQTYGSIEEVLKNIENIKGNKIKENLETYREQAIFSKKLATIITEVPIEFDLDEIKSQEKYDNQGLKKYFLKLQMRSMLDKLPKGEEEINTVEEEIEIIYVRDLETLKSLESNIKNEIFITYDILNKEKYSLMEVNKIYIEGDNKVYLLELKNIIEGNQNEALSIIKNIMENSSVEKIIHDGKALVTAMSKYNIEIKSFKFDTAIAAYLIDSAKSNYNLENLVNEYLLEEVKGEKEEVKAKLTKKLKEIYIILKERIEEENMNDLYYKVEHPLIFVLSSMESLGFNVDREFLDELAVKFRGEISRTEKEIFALAEEEFNINSPKQLGKILFEKHDLPVIKKTKTGYATNAEG